jgi:dTDP-6-deoxy-L-talose 4-dehydrogenase (NAD+)
MESCSGVDTLIHLAWYAKAGEYLNSEQNMDCLIGSLQMIKGATKAGIRKFIGIGTCFEYNFGKEKLSVNSLLNPTTFYAGAKVSLFYALSQYCLLKKIDFVWCRIFYLYGEGENEKRFVAFLHSKLAEGEIAELSSGNQIRDFLDVKNAAKMIVDVSLSNKIGAINICSGIPITIRQFAEKIADGYGRRDLLKFGVRPDNSTDPEYVVGIVDDFFK